MIKNKKGSTIQNFKLFIRNSIKDGKFSSPKNFITAKNGNLAANVSENHTLNKSSANLKNFYEENQIPPKLDNDSSTFAKWFAKILKKYGAMISLIVFSIIFALIMFSRFNFCEFLLRLFERKSQVLVLKKNQCLRKINHGLINCGGLYFALIIFNKFLFRKNLI